MTSLKEKVKKLIEIDKKVSNFIEKAYEINFNVVECDLYRSFNDILEMYFDEICGDSKEKKETLSWFLFEYLTKLEYDGKKPSKENAQMWDKNGNPLCYDVDSLCDYINESDLYQNEKERNNKWNFYNSKVDKTELLKIDTSKVEKSNMD